MSILSNIWNAVFKKKNKEAPPIVKAPPGAVVTPQSAPATTATPTSLPATDAIVPLEVIDIEAIFEELAAGHHQKLNWRTSIVDLMKLLGFDSSLAERRELAAELGYDGDTKDTARMNMWLHKEVIRQFAANGGRVPAEMLD
jgi:hypothetical protein